jgi:hypothetical protein
MRDAARLVGHPNGPRRSMSVTKLKTVGSWQTAHWPSNAVGDSRTNVRGRVITGMLTGGDPSSDALAVVQDRRKEPTR